LPVRHFVDRGASLKGFRQQLGPAGNPGRIYPDSPGIAWGYEAARVHHQISKNRTKFIEIKIGVVREERTGYGLGVGVRSELGHRSLSHGGEVSGFTSENVIFPDERVAVVVLTNLDATDASGAIAKGIARLLLATSAEGIGQS